MKAVELVIRMLGKISLSIASFSVFIILFLVTIEVVSRLLFGRGFSSTVDIVTYYLMISVALMPLAIVELRSIHIRTDLFYGNFSPRMKLIADILALALSMGFYGIITWTTFDQALKSTLGGEVAMGIHLLPIWPARWILPFVFALAALVCFWKLCQTAKGWGARKSAEGGI